MTDKVLAASAEPSPDTLLKQAILGARASAEKTAAPPTETATAWAGRFRVEPRLLAIAVASLGLGALLGAGAMGLAAPRGSEGGETLAQIRHQIEIGRTESERQVERLVKGLAQLQDNAEAARTEAKARHTNLAERLGRAEQSLTTKLAATGDRLEQAEKDQTARLAALTTQIEKRAAAPVPAAAPQAAKALPAEPTETGTIPDKPKPSPAEGWAVREVYDGVAVLEDRKRRLVEVGLGDTVPGVGRIENIERRGKTWVVVTKQGTITPQAW
ncbi:hypothetical protein ASF49_06575 [Methylobacterium sp. Leaf104]|uniref:hypothetical protein n=1 Tax=Methylobacterium TaxID=407 RepID=UPI0006F6D5D0|nr:MULTISPECIES: hypothetical protein [Methylobacterium]KQP33555.1 hypothetical protein ASF49_06575 [Methylobacterium sp. Leaf104]MCI9879919.1 hypothetical protein [Methylobacterium goesingense]